MMSIQDELNAGEEGTLSRHQIVVLAIHSINTEQSANGEHKHKTQLNTIQRATRMCVFW